MPLYVRNAMETILNDPAPSIVSDVYVRDGIFDWTRYKSYRICVEDLSLAASGAGVIVQFNTRLATVDSAALALVTGTALPSNFWMIMDVIANSVSTLTVVNQVHRSWRQNSGVHSAAGTAALTNISQAAPDGFRFSGAGGTVLSSIARVIVQGIVR